MFIRIVTSALVAGVCAGLLAGVLQLIFMQDLLVLAERYETGMLTHFGTATSSDIPREPFDVARTALGLGFNAIVYLGYALILLAIIALTDERGFRLTPRSGLVWGLCGFLAVNLAPAFGLPPELPGFAVADITQRQIWWFFTVAATALALWLIGFGRNTAAWGTAVILIAAPHLIGPPLPEAYSGPTPPELASEYAGRSLGIAAIGWATLGLLCTSLWQSRWTEKT